MKIPATDLRIGNLVMDDQNIIGTIATLESDKFKLWNGSDEGDAIEIHGEQFLSSYLQGLPLTPQILIKTGFEKRGNEWDFNGTCFERINDEFYYSAGEGLKLSRNIAFVHELQNLYFALTGEELNIQL